MRAAKTRERRAAGGGGQDGPRPSGPSGAPGPGRPAKAEIGAPAGKVRLQRFMADAGVAARRVCERLIEEGRVTINGEVKSRLPVFIDPAHDKIAVEGRVLPRGRAGSVGGGGGAGKTGQSGRVYVMLHKPERVMTTLRDDGGRTTVADLVKREGPERLFPVGRLDFHASGMVLLTNDGELANRLTHARYGVPKTYHLAVRGTVSPEQLATINEELGYVPPPAPPPGAAPPGRGEARAPVAPPPVIIWSRADGAPSHADELDQRAMGKAKTIVRVTVTPRRYLNLPDLFLRCGLSVVKIVQVGVGGQSGLEMKGLSVGAWRELTRDEARALRASAGVDEVRPQPVRPRPARRSPESDR